MDALWRTALWQQFGAAIDMLGNALLACPDTHWHDRLWSDNSDDPQPPEVTEFWYLTYHTLFWLDFYLTGSLEGFAPPAPFTLSEIDPAGVLPERAYTKDELHTYLAYLRQKCRTTLVGLSDEHAHREITFRWTGGKPLSFLELVLYNMRHVQEHGAQLNMFLGQNAIPVIDDWVARAEAEKSNE